MWRQLRVYKKKIKDVRLPLSVLTFFFVLTVLVIIHNPVPKIAQHTPSLENGVYALSPSGEKGGAIIPASCPSYEHIAGDCDAPAWISGSCPGAGTSATVTWASSPLADHYWLRVDNTSDGDGFTCPSSATDICNDNQLGTSLTFGSVPGATYNAWVHWANSAGENSSLAKGTSFTCATPPPPVPPPPAWISGSCPGAGTSATVTWASSAGADHYLLRVDNTSDGDGFTCPPSATDICNDSELGTSLTFGSVSGATYNAWVHAANSSGYSAPASSSFTCGIISTPLPPPPPPAWISGSCPGAGTSATVTWASSAGADHYLLRVDNISDGDGFTCPPSATDICNNNELGTSLTFGSVSGATYNAWVHAANSAGYSSPTGASFTCGVIGTPTPPPPPPAWISGSCPVPGTRATVTWASSVGADHYLLRVDNISDGNGFTCPASATDICNDSELGTSLTFGSVSGATYNAWVHAANSSGYSAPASSSFTCGVVARTPTPLPSVIETPPQ